MEKFGQVRKSMIMMTLMKMMTLMLMLTIVDNHDQSTILHNTLSKRNIPKHNKTRCKPHTVKPSSGVLHSQLRPSLDQPETTDIANTTQRFLDVSGCFWKFVVGIKVKCSQMSGGLWEGTTRISQNMQTPYTLSPPGNRLGCCQIVHWSSWACTRHAIQHHHMCLHNEG